MPTITRRQFGAIALVLGARPGRLFGATGLDDALRATLQRRKIPAATAMVTIADKTTYVGAFGKRDSASGIDVTPNSIFAIASPSAI